jgi:ATP-binding protein involved in chromosome partitioning
MIAKEEVADLLAQVIYPGFTKSIVDFNFLKDFSIEEGKITIKLDIPSASPKIKEQLIEEIKQRFLPKTDLEIEIYVKQPKAQRESSSYGKNVLPDIENFVMVSSGKGGVGKSTTTVNLAIALAQQGKRVGLLDADVYGPNIPRMMGIEGQQPIFLGQKIKPIIAHNVQVMSIGSLVERGASLIWKGAMVTQAIEQMLEDILWNKVDILLFDMPPGTGDAQLALAQNLPVTAGVCVTTPQKVALDDTIRSMDMFKNIRVPIAGVVENMSGFICPDSGKEYPIFGKGTTKPLIENFNTQLLGEIPIEPAIREGGDNGIPICALAPNSETAKRYAQAAEKLWDFVLKINEEGGVDNSSIQPTIF